MSGGVGSGLSMAADRPKVFGIGFHKTATTSLANALYCLGYNVTGFFGQGDPDIAQNVLDEAFDRADRFDAAQDTPWPVLYRFLDERYPGSKFILTVRPTEQWIASVVGHFKDHRIATHEWIYGVPTALGFEDVYRERYERHNREVQEHFAGRPDALMVMDMTQIEDWAPLCEFLDLEVPDSPYPRQNSAPRRSIFDVSRAIGYAGRTVGAIRNKEGDPTMGRTVTTAFIRDLIHYHYLSFERVMAAVEQMDPNEFAEPRPSFGGRSVRSVLGAQLDTEFDVLSAMTTTESRRTFTATTSIPVAVESWERSRFAVRKLAADQTDIAVNTKPDGRAEYVWELLMQLVTEGMRNLAVLELLVADAGQKVDPPDFLELFRDPSRRTPAAQVAAFKERLAEITGR